MSTWIDESDIESSDYDESFLDESDGLDDAERRGGSSAMQAMRRRALAQQRARLAQQRARRPYVGAPKPVSASAAIRQTQAAVTDARIEGKVGDDILRGQQRAMNKRMDSHGWAIMGMIVQREAEKSFPKLFENTAVQTVARASPALLLKSGARGRRDQLWFGGAIVGLAVVGQLTQKNEKDQEVDDVVFTSTSQNVTVFVGGGPAKVQAVALNKDGEVIHAKRKEITFAPRQPEIATVDPDGFVTGVKAGNTRITASIGAISGQMSVEVVERVNGAVIDPVPALK